MARITRKGRIVLDKNKNVDLEFVVDNRMGLSVEAELQACVVDAVAISEGQQIYLAEAALTIPSWIRSTG